MRPAEDKNFSQPIRWEMVAFQRRLKKAPQRKDGLALDVVFRASWDDAKSTVTLRPAEPDTIEPRELHGEMRCNSRTHAYNRSIHI